MADPISFDDLPTSAQTNLATPDAQGVGAPSSSVDMAKPVSFDDLPFADVTLANQGRAVPAWLAPSYHMPTPSQKSYDDFLKNTVTGAVKAVSSIPNTLGQAAEGAGETTYFPDPSTYHMGIGDALKNWWNGTLPAPIGQQPIEDRKPEDLPGSLVSGSFFNHVMPEYKPQTLGGRLWQAGSGGAALGAIGGPWSSFLGLLSGIGSQGGGEAGGAMAGPWGAKAGSILGGMAAPAAPGLLAMRPSALGNVVREGTQDLSPGDWANAQRLQDQSYGIGAPLLSTEALDSPSLQRFTADTMASRTGAPAVNSFLRDRPGQVRDVVNRDVLGPIAPSPSTTNDTAQTVQGAAEKSIQTAERDRSAQTSPFYQTAATDQVAPQDVAPLISQLDRLIAADPGNLNPTLRQTRASLVAQNPIPAVPPTRGQYVNGAYQPATPGSPAQPLVPFTDIATLDRARKILRDRVELPPTAADAVGQTAAAETGGTLSNLRDAMTTASPDFAQGRALHEQISQDTVAPLQRSDIGVLANRAGIPENTGIQSQINVISNPSTARPDQIRYVAGHLNMADATAFPQLARTYFENAFDKATVPLQSGENPKMGFNFAKSVNGSDAQKANNQAILEGVAQAHGIPTGGLQAGFNNAMEIFDRMGRIPGVGSPTAERLASNAELGSGPGTGLLNLTIDKPASWIGMSADKLKGMYMSRAYRQFSQMITSPDGVQQLRQLSMLNPQSRQAQMIVGQLAGLIGLLDPGQQNTQQ